MADQERKSVEPIALRFAENPQGGMPAENEVVALQGFLRDSPWEAGDVFCEIQAVFAEELVPSAAGSPIGTVGVIDESGVAKSGDQSVGAAVQWCGRLGKTANCQVGVHLIGVTPAGFAALDAQLFLPEGWIDLPPMGTCACIEILVPQRFNPIRVALRAGLFKQCSTTLFDNS